MFCWWHVCFKNISCYYNVIFSSSMLLGSHKACLTHDEWLCSHFIIHSLLCTRLFPTCCNVDNWKFMAHINTQQGKLRIWSWVSNWIYSENGKGKKVINDSEEHNEMKWFKILQLFLWHHSLNKRDGRIFIRCFHYCLFFFCMKGASPFPCKERFPILSFPIVILFRLVTYLGGVVPLIQQSPESLMWPIAVVVHRPLTSRIIG